MKTNKLLSVVLALVMVLSLSVPAFAASCVHDFQPDYSTGTLVMICTKCRVSYTPQQPASGGSSTTFTYTGAANETYTVTVPAELAPGGSGTVKLEGTWQSNRVVTVGADATVTLTNDISGTDEKELAITFDGIELAGDNTKSLSTSKTISVANIEKALFGNWTGAFNYQVAIADVTVEN